jgi:hypothetical protein
VSCAASWAIGLSPSQPTTSVWTLDGPTVLFFFFFSYKALHHLRSLSPFRCRPHTRAHHHSEKPHPAGPMGNLLLVIALGLLLVGGAATATGADDACGAGHLALASASRRVAESCAAAGTPTASCCESVIATVPCVCRVAVQHPVDHSLFLNASRIVALYSSCRGRLRLRGAGYLASAACLGNHAVAILLQPPIPPSRIPCITDRLHLDVLPPSLAVVSVRAISMRSKSKRAGANRLCLLNWPISLCRFDHRPLASGV